MKQIIFYIAMFALLFMSCEHEELHPEFQSAVMPSAYQWKGIGVDEESQQNVLFLFPDSIFLLLKKNSSDSVWNGSFGNWDVHNAKMHLYQDECSMVELGFESDKIKVLEDNRCYAHPVIKCPIESLRASDISDFCFVSYVFYNGESHTLRFPFIDKAFELLNDLPSLMKRDYSVFKYLNGSKSFNVKMLIALRPKKELENDEFAVWLSTYLGHFPFEKRK